MKKLFLSLLLACGLTACGIGDTNSTYERSDIGRQSRVEYGTILEMSQVNTAGTSTVGTVGGAVAGGAAGSMLGGNTALNVIGAVGGAIAGGVIGNATESAITKDTAIEYIVRTDSGRVTSVVQSASNLRVGDRVLMITTGGTTRIRLSTGR